MSLILFTTTAVAAAAATTQVQICMYPFPHPAAQGNSKTAAPLSGQNIGSLDLFKWVFKTGGKQVGEANGIGNVLEFPCAQLSVSLSHPDPSFQCRQLFFFHMRNL